MNSLSALFPNPPSPLSLPSSRDRELVRITSTPVHLSLIDYNVKPVYLVGISYTRRVWESCSKLLPIYSLKEDKSSFWRLPFDVLLAISTMSQDIQTMHQIFFLSFIRSHILSQLDYTPDKLFSKVMEKVFEKNKYNY